MDSYESYLNHEAGDVLPVEEALKIYKEIFESAKACNAEDVDEFLDDFLKKACRYAATRARWEFWSNSEKMEKDASRTIEHNAFIDSTNILARLLNSEGIETPWRERLGDKRKRIGDFACFVAYMVGINNR